MNKLNKLLSLFYLSQILLIGCAKNNNSEIEIMKTTGPYSVGTIRYYFTDKNRPEIFTPENNDYREVAIKIWYPAKKSSCLKKAPYIEKAIERKNKLPNNSSLPPSFFDKIAHIKSNSFYDAAISDKQEKYPIILFSHAYSAGMNANSILMEELASYGYITVSIGHAYETSHFIKEDGSIKVFSYYNKELMKRAIERKNSFSIQRKINDTNDEKELKLIIKELMDKRSKIMESLKIWVEDITFIINKLEELNNSEGIFYKKLDLDKIGVIGHSFGGVAAGQACIVEKRCKAGVNLDGLQLGDMLKRPLEKPFMFMHHDNERAINKKPNKIFFNQSKSTAYMLLIKGASHFNFSDLSLPFYSKILEPPKGFLGSIDGYRCLKIQNDYVRAFFDKHLCNKKLDLLNGYSKDYPEVDINIKK